MSFKAHLGNLKKDNRYIGILERTDLTISLLAAEDKILLLQPVILPRRASIKGCKSSLLNLS
jgi:hypothetical protein